MKHPHIIPRDALHHLRGFNPNLPDRTIPELRRMLNTDDVIKLSFNESPYGPSPQAVAAMQRAASQVNFYHDPEGKELRAALAEFYRVDASRVYLSNGGDEAITLVGQAFLSPGDETVIPAPTFGQYNNVTRLMAAEPVHIAVRADMSVDLQAMLNAITGRTKIIFLCNPNNPTGHMAGQAELRSFVAAVPQRILIVLDEAYAEFVTDREYLSGIDLLNDYPNVVVVRTFSKIYGMAGLRLGYGIASPEIAGMVNRARAPFNVNALAQAGGLAALKDRGYAEKVAGLNAAERDRLTRELTALGFFVYPSQTNFIFADTRQDSVKLFEALAGEGIIIRPGTGWNLPTFVRISLGSHEQNTRLLTAIKRYLG